MSIVVTIAVIISILGGLITYFSFEECSGKDHATKHKIFAALLSIVLITSCYMTFNLVDCKNIIREKDEYIKTEQQMNEIILKQHQESEAEKDTVISRLKKFYIRTKQL